MYNNVSSQVKHTWIIEEHARWIANHEEYEGH